jgi:hypothetical protein
MKARDRQRTQKASREGEERKPSQGINNVCESLSGTTGLRLFVVVGLVIEIFKFWERRELKSFQMGSTCVQHSCT